MQSNPTLKTFIKANFDKITAANIKTYYLNYIETSEDETATLKDFKEIYKELKAKTKEEHKEELKEEDEEKPKQLKEIEKRILLLLNLDNLKHTASGLKSVNYAKKYLNYLLNNNRLNIMLNNLEDIKDLINQTLFKALKEFWEENKKSIKEYYEETQRQDIFNIFDYQTQKILFFYFNLLGLINYNDFKIRNLEQILIYLADIEKGENNSEIKKEFFKCCPYVSALDCFKILDDYKDLNIFLDVLNLF